METHLCESQSAEADNDPCNGEDAKAKKESENDESIQQTSQESHKSLASLEHEDRANQKADCSIDNEDDLCVSKRKWLHEFSHFPGKG